MTEDKRSPKPFRGGGTVRVNRHKKVSRAHEQKESKSKNKARMVDLISTMLFRRILNCLT